MNKNHPATDVLLKVIEDLRDSFTDTDRAANGILSSRRNSQSVLFKSDDDKALVVIRGMVKETINPNIELFKKAAESYLKELDKKNIPESEQAHVSSKVKSLLEEAKHTKFSNAYFIKKENRGNLDKEFEKIKENIGNVCKKIPVVKQDIIYSTVQSPRRSGGA